MQPGIIRVPLAPIRSEADDRAEMVTQGLFGERLKWKALDAPAGWAKITLERDGYQGYTDVKLISSDPDALEAFGQKTSRLSAPLTMLEWQGRPYHLPAGSRVPESIWPLQAQHQDLPVDVASRFLGAPYLWGGKSVLGMDCSGLTQLACDLCGIALPRDASDQWDALKSDETSFRELLHGDLVFFHRKNPTQVTHVGFAWKPSEGVVHVLHASGEVRIDLLTSEGILRDGAQTHLWTGAARCPVSSE